MVLGIYRSKKARKSLVLASDEHFGLEPSNFTVAAAASQLEGLRPYIGQQKTKT